MKLLSGFCLKIRLVGGRPKVIGQFGIRSYKLDE